MTSSGTCRFSVVVDAVILIDGGVGHEAQPATRAQHRIFGERRDGAGVSSVPLERRDHRGIVSQNQYVDVVLLRAALQAAMTAGTGGRAFDGMCL